MNILFAFILKYQNKCDTQLKVTSNAGYLRLEILKTLSAIIEKYISAIP